MAGEILSLRTVLKQSLRDLGLEGRLRSEQIWVVWPQVVGPAVAKITHPKRLRSGTLFVDVADNVWVQELKLQERELTARLNDALGEAMVQRLFLRLGDIPLPLESQRPAAADAPEGETPLGPQQESLLEQEVVGVRDPHLREVLKNFRRRMLYARPQS